MQRGNVQHSFSIPLDSLSVNFDILSLKVKVKSEKWLSIQDWYFPGLFVLSTNVWTGGYFVFKSFQHLSSVKFVDHQMRNQGLNVSL